MERSTVFPACTKKYTKKNAYIQFADIGWLPILVCIFMFSAMFIPYIIASARGTVNPLVPFVSQAAGSPPQSGIFSVFLSLSAIVGFFGLHLLNLGICVFQERVSKGKRRVLQFLNKAALIPAHTAVLGMIIVGGYPVDFHRHEEDWILVTVAPHTIGAVMLFGGGVAYCSIITVIMIITFPEKKKLLGIRVFLLVTTMLATLIHSITVRKAFYVEYNDEDRLKLCHLKRYEYDNNHVLSATCEWVLAITFVSFFITMREEAKLMSFTVSVDLLNSDDHSEDKVSNDMSQTSSPPNMVSSVSKQCLVGDVQAESSEPSLKSAR